MKKGPEVDIRSWLADSRFPSVEREEEEESWYETPAPERKVFILSDAETMERGRHQLLTANEGFPWCSISPQTFMNRGIAIKDIDLTEVKYILAQGTTDLYPELNSSQLSRRFSPLYIMGIYVHDEPVGFSYSGLQQWSCFVSEDDETNDEDELKVTEVGLVHIAPKRRDQGYGSLLADLTRLRLLALEPTHLTTHVYDKSGKVIHMLNTLGYQATKRTDKEGNPEFAKDIRGVKKDVLQQQLEQRMRKKLS